MLSIFSALGVNLYRWRYGEFNENDDKKDMREDDGSEGTKTVSAPAYRTGKISNINVDRKLSQADETLSRSENALDTYKFRSALRHADDGVDTLEKLEVYIGGGKNRKKVQTRLEQARRLRDRIETNNI